MCSYKNLAILALVASSVSPALSAPTPYGKEYFRAESLDYRPKDKDVIFTPSNLAMIGGLTAGGAGLAALAKAKGIIKRANEAPESWDIAELEGRTLDDYDHTEQGLSLKSVRALLAANDILTKGNPGALSKRRINHKALDKALNIIGDIGKGLAIVLRRADVLPEDLVTRALNELD